MAVLAAVLLLLGGCGFKPIYQQTDALGNVRVAKIGERRGQLLRNNLEMALSVSKRRQPLYMLSVSLSEHSQQVGIRLSGDLATRGNLIMTASFSLKEIADGKSIYSGSYKTIGSYDIVGDSLANRAAREHTRLVLVNDVSRNILNRIALFLQKK